MSTGCERKRGEVNISEVIMTVVQKNSESENHFLCTCVLGSALLNDAQSKIS